ncbi:signal transduction histidine kinase [Glaciihabitans tibetensis]|uniref:Signal transduction histidine kinase n=1 Tax=Glaciihabitans tibetensis TaxID=1266600 RepID=A0A2T0VA69_9MICO|nr:ATP-binding protein [Glaciihabitans tibetensis]PRY67080.1 signal transduction histidine kinase [Glaciihabitans tibetensis]
MAEVGPGERSARRVLAVDSALLVVLVVAVYLSIVAQGGQGDFPLWSLSIGIFAASVTVLAGVVAWRVSDRSLRVMASVAVGGYWATLLTFAAAVPAEGIDRIPWTLSASAAAAAAALAASGQGLAWVTVIAGAIAGLLYRTLFGGLDLDGVVNDVQALLTGAVICVIGGHILSVGRGLDVAAVSTTAAAARESAERGRLAARTRAAAVVHDEVLATLTLAASGLPVPRDRLAAQAREAVSMVTRLTEKQAREPMALVASLGNEARLHGARFTVRGESTVTSAVAVHDALVGATRQALRNSRQHAPDAVLTVVLQQVNGEIRVEITDDGPGFDPAAIAQDRLGIRQSIVGRMARVRGGSAEIESAPGAGTVVRLLCSTAPVGELTPSEGRGALRRGVTVISVAYVVLQTICAILASIAMPGTWQLQLAVLGTALFAAEVLRRSPRRVPSPWRTGVVVALACGGLAVGATAVYLSDRMTFNYGTMWFAAAFAFLLVPLVLRGRIPAALAGAGVIVVVLVIAGVLSGAAAPQIAQVTFRPLVLVGLAAALVRVVDRMQRRITALHRDALASAERESWTLAERSELTGRVAELARTAVPMLERIGTLGAVTDVQRREYARCEGELRDGLRAGSLAREPLAATVAAARERGVDVLLLDDSDDVGGDRQIRLILVWMAAAINTAQSRAVGRLLPAGRDARATITVDGRHTKFPASPVDHPSVMSFHGE